MRKPLTLLLAVGALGGAVAGCGSSTAAAPGVVLAPSSGATADSTTASVPSSTSTTSTTSAASVPTPKTGPLSKEPVISAPKGNPPKTVQTKDLVKGTGAVAKAGDTITVNYVGALYSNGKVFDASWKRNQTFTTPLSTSAIIPGWVKGIPGMKVGGRRELIIPSVDGYGKRGSGSTIPPNSALIFVIDLLKT